jgi:hypothetical protein
MGNRVFLTCIMSTIPHEHVHSVFTSMCIASTFKIIAPQNNESSTPQIHQLSKGASKIDLKLPHEIILRTINYGTLLQAFLLSQRSFDNPRRLDPLPPIYKIFQQSTISDQMSSRSRSFLERSRFSKSPCGKVIHRLSVLNPYP